MQTIQKFKLGNDLDGNAQPLERWNWVTGNTELNLSVFRYVKHQKWGTLIFLNDFKWVPRNTHINVCTISINTGSEFKSESARVIRSHSIRSKFRQHVRTKVLTHCKSFVKNWIKTQLQATREPWGEALALPRVCNRSLSTHKHPLSSSRGCSPGG